MSRWKGIVLHCSASGWGTEKDVDSWHKRRGWRGTGYHFVIDNGYYANDLCIDAMDGSIEAGRNLFSRGAHALNYNRSHLGICGISNGTYTRAQAISIYKLVNELRVMFDISIENIIGHNETGSPKECPCYEVSKLREALELDDMSAFVNYLVGANNGV